jgi:hypothetical protein
MRLILLSLCLLSGSPLWAQVSVSVFGGATYAWTTFRQTPADALDFSFSGLFPMYGPAYGLRVGYALLPSLQLALSTGYQGMGFTTNDYQQYPLHLIPLQLDLMVHAEQAPAWLKRLSLGGGMSVKGILNRPKQNLIFGYGATKEDLSAVWGVQGRIQYQLPWSLLIGVQYDHHFSPHTRDYLFNGALVLHQLHRAVSATLGYQIR